MKKYKITAFAVLIIIVIIISFTIYNVYGKNKENNNIKDKALSEVKYLENKFENLFNEMNNIKFENYKIISSEIKKEESNSSSKESSSSDSSSGSSSSDSSESSSQSSNNSEKTTKDTSTKDDKKYELEKEGILTSNSELNWKDIKNQIENIYTLLPGITLDLYQLNINQQDITNFNSEYDNLTKSIKEENKNTTLQELTKLYDYLPKFIEKCTDSEKEKTKINIKNNIFKAYSILDLEDWDAMSNYINIAIQETTQMLTNVEELKNNNQYNINRIYINVNELQNAVKIKDKEIFLIKYKNLLEELSYI